MESKELAAAQSRNHGLVHVVGFREYCELIISRRKLERIRSRVACLHDTVSDELFVLATEAGSPEERAHAIALLH